ncbi:helix-turn-helix domain-containing protein [Brucella intermedia]|uniref:helix-turn-helix domain-containing protein n=1 Tax=Brucella intermedia TaxID=94625 RepID=UPI00235F0F16|nr:helix-turn-helix domain-containing protein [Brucella intermedia]
MRPVHAAARVGRPPKLKPADLKAANALLADLEINVEDVARRLGVSPATLYRHIPAALSSVGLVGKPSSLPGPLHRYQIS